MTVMEFFGCTFIAFGPPLALFIFTIANDPLRVIVLIASSFFWLIALLLSSIWWFAVVPLRDVLAFGLVFSVLFQEIFRCLFYFLLKKAEEGLKQVWQQEEEESTTLSLVSNKHLMAYVAGLGFGLISGAFSLINVLADMAGPGTIGIHGHNSMFFITSAFFTLCFVLLHTFWGVLFFDGMEKGKLGYIKPVVVFLSHMLVSSLTLLNQGTDPPYLATLLPAYLILLATGVWTFFVAGGTCRNLERAFSDCCRRSKSSSMTVNCPSPPSQTQVYEDAL